MKLIERIHEVYVQQRRIDALSRCCAAMIPEGAAVLDVGCGDGQLARRIAQARPDVSIKGLEVLARPDASAAISIGMFDGETLPFADGSFDVVMFVDVLHHTEAPLRLLREAVRVSSRAVVIKDHLVRGPLARTTLRFMDGVGNRRHGVALPHNYWTEQQWRDAFRELGLQTQLWETRLNLYPLPARFIFERSLHFVARLGVTIQADLPYAV